jgi:ubiquinone/menaquinone biosynthesis C-methylase UbiE
MDNHVCPWWLAYTFDNPLRRILHPPEKVLSDFISKGDTVMDIGCGMGHFTIAMAKLVGAEGLVIAVDIQEQMLTRVHSRAEKHGLSERIHLYNGEVSGRSEKGLVDFALAFWMVHEVPDQTMFFKGVKRVLKPEGRFLVVEPKIHTTVSDFQKTLNIVRNLGMHVCSEPAIRMSRAVLLVTTAKTA